MKKQRGKINEIIYKNTFYLSGNRNFVTIIGLERLIGKIIEANETTEYIRFTPFYRNSRLGSQIEFDEYMFYLECRENFSEEDIKNHLSECMDKKINEMTKEEIRMAEILYPLCKTKDVEDYKQLILTYKTFLNQELILFLFNIVKKEIKLVEDDIPFGYFCFEVHSG